MKKYGLYAALTIVLFASCAVAPAVQHYHGNDPYYTGSADGASFLAALKQAKANALKLAIIDLIGDTEELQYRSQLYSVFYADSNPLSYLENDYMLILRRDEGMRGAYCEISIPVKIQKVRQTLGSLGIYGKATTASDGNMQTSPEVQEAKLISAGKGNSVSFIEQYTDSMLYMVVPSKQAKAGNAFSKSAISMANKYLLDNGYRAVDYAAVEALQADSATLFNQEPETADLSVVQWIAQKLGADVYIEVEGITQSGRESGGYFGKAEVNLKMYNPSTGELLGAVPYSSPKTFDRASAEAAAQNAIKSTVFKAMRAAVDQAKKSLIRDYAQGIRYEVIINNTADSKLMSRFRAKLKNEVETIRVMNQSAAQTKYAVQYFGTVEDMEDMIYTAAEGISGLEKMELVMIRGKTLMFRSGQ
ncbi:MAG: hypothetical protein ACTTI6_07570 [Treponema sp.]|uniref:hypothetical protein n=1 Tax=Treponema sp. TaxID=166 RepID=UPI003FA21663